jgi:hypothetical protein
MTTTLLVHAVSAMLAVAAAQGDSRTQAAQSDRQRAQTAGERFKSVRVLTDMPATLMIDYQVTFAATEIRHNVPPR